MIACRIGPNLGALGELVVVVGDPRLAFWTTHNSTVAKQDLGESTYLLSRKSDAANSVIH